MLVENEASTNQTCCIPLRIVSLHQTERYREISKDPTVTMTVGRSADQDKPVKVAVDVEFYDKDGKCSALVSVKLSLTQLLNHWNGAAYVETSERPRPLTVGERR